MEYLIIGGGLLFVIAIEALKRRSPYCEVGCGAPWACKECHRCADRKCNAGCINCRPRSEWDPISRSINKLGEKLFSKSATMGATKGSSAPVPSCPILSYGSEGAGTLSEGVCSTHNAGVGSSSLPPATRQGVVAQWVTRLVAHLFARSATTGATKPSGILATRTLDPKSSSKPLTKANTRPSGTDEHRKGLSGSGTATNSATQRFAGDVWVWA